MQSNKFNLNLSEFLQDVKSLNDFDNVMNGLYKDGIQELLKAELSHHLGYSKHSPDGINSGNSRNGSYKKKIRTTQGQVELDIPRDRNGEFEPIIVPKGQTTTEKVESVITSLYSRGMSTDDITAQIQEIYGLDVSKTFVSDITNKMIPAIQEWQNRPLDNTYYIVWMDCICFKIRQDNKIINKSIYIVIGLKTNGIKEVLGIWMSANESAAFWLSVLNELKDRGVKKMLIACTDNLTGFTQAIQTAFPDTVSQLCIVHQIRNSMKFVPWKDRRAFLADLKTVYAALNMETALIAFEAFKAKWGSKYAYAIKSWEANWSNLSPMFQYPTNIRKIMYTTNTIEGLNRAIRKFTKTKTLFPNDQAALKSVYLAIQQIQVKWTMPIHNWHITHNEILIIFEDNLIQP
ncbi:MAG: IS256 family transposase [Saprospiraceae bacterium]|jgi:putative transposase|nr:IS256 family transposase [Saprospiraceae bacterium]MBK8054885.1 IS256 family transposase [Saprospiraceae bacterium]MBK8054995.1 IS256 family transposase [Saprospiraceae bacterium]MBK8055971.1 IS256 family transposase [Saprospiraceae bacterium]